MPAKARGLTTGFIEKSNKPGRYGDGAGLYLLIRPTGRWFLFRYKGAGGRLRELGLGPAAGPGRVTLSEARRRRDQLLADVRAGRDPLAEKAAAKAAEKVLTFKAAAEQYIAAHAPTWRSNKHRHQWKQTLIDHAYPIIGSLPVPAIDTNAVLRVLTPIWNRIPETAGRVRTRLEAIIDYASLDDDRKNPARWKGHLDKRLPAPRKLAPIKHHAALPYAELPSLMARLRALPGAAARLLEFTILTAARSGEAIGARWDEVDMTAATWTVPGERMKAGRLHRVPLSQRALEILDEMKTDSSFVFPGARVDKPLSTIAMRNVMVKHLHCKATIHGFRSTFSDWVSEQTNFPSALAEMALAHHVGNAVARAYRRGDMIDRRRTLADAWAAYAASGPAVDNVLPIIRARS